MTRDNYIGDLTSRLVSHIHEKVKATVRPQVDVEKRARQLEKTIQQKLEKALNKSLDNLEKRFFKYADKCVSLSENRKFERISSWISRAENDVDANFNEGQTQTGFVAGRGDIHGQVLKECYYDLVDNLNILGSRLLDILYGEHIVSESDDRSIREKTSSREQNKEFVDIICHKLSPEEFNETFLPALKEDHPLVFTKLVEKLSEMEESYEERQCLSCRVRNNVQVHRLAKPLLRRGAIHLSLHADLCRRGLSNRCKWAELDHHRVHPRDVIEALEKKYPNYYDQFKQNRTTSLECCCQQELGKREIVDDHDIVDYPSVRDDPSYPPSENPSTKGSEVDMRDVDAYVDICEIKGKDYPVKQGSCRGICLIINNKNFSTPRFRTRSGSEIDVEKLSATFTRLGFLVVTEIDLTSDHIRARIREFSKHTDFSDYDAFICCLMTHGNNDILYGSDGANIPLSEITAEFTSSKCPSLAGKPKIFIVQADRGKTRMQGFKLPTEMAEAGEGVQTVADMADFLIGYCTPHGYASYRGRSTGSWYIKTLCEVLESNADSQDLLANLVEVNARVAELIGRHGEQQVPAPMFTLTKYLYLTIDPLTV
ncbi:uncharacterized protein [Haliotis asinina]|uniref:uncharacterized protein n=1 Tax=Haliotis asinina TaxID=109174 RepID=UPI0035326EF5